MKTLTKRLIPVFIVVCVCLTMMVGLVSNAADADDFYYWNYEETLNDVGDRLNLTSKAAAEDADAEYYDGVIDNTSALDLASQRHATVNVGKEVTSFTFASWVYLPSDCTRASAFSGVMTAGHKDTTESFINVYFMEQSDEFNLRFTVGSVGDMTNDDLWLEEDEWYHVAASYDATTKTAKIYLNGVCKETRVIDTNFTGLTADTPLYIGHEKGNWLFLDGLVDESVFAPSVWTDAKIAELYSDPAAAAASMKEILDPAPATTAPATTSPAATATAPATSANPGTGDMTVFFALGAMVVMLTSVLTVISVSKKKNH